jgi:hypothetical protein
LFFHFIKVKALYEYEGYQTSVGYYVPDFWLPDHELWVEIKPVEPTHEQKQSLYEVCKGTGYNGLIFHGSLSLPVGERQLLPLGFNVWGSLVRFDCPALDWGIKCASWQFETLPEFLRLNGFENVPECDGQFSTLMQLAELDKQYIAAYGKDTGNGGIAILSRIPGNSIEMGNSSH